MKDMKLQQIQSVAIETYVRAGWHQDRLLPHFLTKEFATAAGPKMATIVVGMLEMDSASYLWLTGTYWSEGRNVLEPHTRLIPSCLKTDLWQHKVAEYLIWAERVIHDTFAARLYKAAA